MRHKHCVTNNLLMSLVDHHGEVEYPFSKKTVFKALMQASQHISGLSLDNADELSGRVTFKAGVSLASWGENIPVQLNEISPYKTQMKVMSTPKTGIMFGGAMDFGKNQENINKIINAVSAELSKVKPEIPNAEASVNVADELIKLKQLKDSGVLTDEEFNQQKKKVLDGNPSPAEKQPQEVSLIKNEEHKANYSPSQEPVNSEGSSMSKSTKYALIAGVIFLVIYLLSMIAS